MNFLHYFTPESILISFGFFNIYWYGLFIVLGIIISLLLCIKIAGNYKISKNKIIDLAFYTIIGGIIGARIYHVLLELPYYLKNPIETLKIWQGGLAIHGAIIVGLIIMFIYSKKQKINFWLLASITVPGLALAQAIGRWGNYFNQELFGLPTNLPWGIPIEMSNRPLNYISNEYFHPTFLYESLGSFLLFLILLSFHVYIKKSKKLKTKYYIYITAFYLILYSFLRFSLEFIRIDRTPELLNLRFPQIASLVIIALTIIITTLLSKKEKYDNLN